MTSGQQASVYMTDPPPGGAARRLDPDAIRAALGNYPTGVVVVTATTDNTPVGMVVGTFSSVSLDPPLVAYMPMKTSRTFAAIRRSSHFCVNVLAADQEAVCRVFTLPHEQRFQKLSWRRGPHGSPVLDGVVGWIECEQHAVHDAGDHHIALGGIRSLSIERDCLPLLFFQRGYGRFQHGALMAAGTRDMIDAVNAAELARDEVERLAGELAVECAVQAVVSGELVIVLSANHAPHRGPSRLGYRAPFVPPLGMLLLDAEGAPGEHEWLARLGRDRAELSPLIEQQRARARRRGWSLTLQPDRRTGHLDDFMSRYSTGQRTPQQERAIAEIVREMTCFHEPELPEGGEPYRVLQVSVPVRDGTGTRFVLRLGSLPELVTSREIQLWISRLRQAAELISERLTGRIPS